VEALHALLDLMQTLREFTRIAGARDVAVVLANCGALERFYDPRDKSGQLVSFIGSLQDLFHRHCPSRRFRCAATY
jgi:hypothetical protein